MGFRSTIAQSTLADANRTRDWRIYGDLAQGLISRARAMYIEEPLGIELNQTIDVLDSTTIDLCLTLFPWAKFRSTKAAIKLHTLLDERGPIPTFIAITTRKEADVKILDELAPEPGAFYIMDRGYLDFARLYPLHRAAAFFVTRTKAGVLLNRMESRPVDRTTDVRSDHVVYLRAPKSAIHYPETLRRIAYRVPEDAEVLIFLTNNFILSAENIAKLYNLRWRVELFFKWIKQNLRLQHFFGTTDNAVKSQIWIAICVYILVAIARKELKLNLTLPQILQILSVKPFKQVLMAELVTNSLSNLKPLDSPKHLMLFK